ncbi:MAG: element excision factor XisH family protein [Blastocatellia bacterium]
MPLLLQRSRREYLLPRHDAYHEVVKRALIDDGWTITHDPLVVRYKGLRVYIDLAAEKASPNSKIAIEVKVFGGNSTVDDFEKAIGQYNLYRDILRRKKIRRELFLAIGRKAYKKLGRIPALLESAGDQKVHLLIFDEHREEVVEWIRRQS